MTVKYLLFDFDNTLYDPSVYKMEQYMMDKVYQFSMEKLHISYEEAFLILEGYYKKYGCVAAGLALENKIPIEEQIMEFDFSMLKPNSKLKFALKQIPIRKAIFSNGYDYYVKGALKALKLADCFDNFITATELGTTPKPNRKSFEIACNLLGVHPSECVFFDDNIDNLKSAKEIGMYTVLCNYYDKDIPPFVDFRTNCLESELEKILKRLA